MEQAPILCSPMCVLIMQSMLLEQNPCEYQPLYTLWTAKPRHILLFIYTTTQLYQMQKSSKALKRRNFHPPVSDWSGMGFEIPVSFSEWDTVCILLYGITVWLFSVVGGLEVGFSALEEWAKGDNQVIPLVFTNHDMYTWFCLSCMYVGRPVGPKVSWYKGFLHLLTVLWMWCVLKLSLLVPNSKSQFSLQDSIHFLLHLVTRILYIINPYNTLQLDDFVLTSYLTARYLIRNKNVDKALTGYNIDNAAKKSNGWTHPAKERNANIIIRTTRLQSFQEK